MNHTPLKGKNKLYPMFSNSYKKNTSCESINTLARNLRFTLYTAGVKRSEWIERLASRLSVDVNRAQELLEGEDVVLSQAEVDKLVQYLRMNPEDLYSKDLIQKHGIDPVTMNVGYLINSLPHGEQKHLANALSVDVTTISRWKSGTQKPSKKKIALIRKYFNLPENTDLSEDVFFFSNLPVGETEVKNWLHDKIDELDGETLRYLFPALSRLFKNGDK